MTARHQGLLFMALGFAVWMAMLSVLYGVQATGCEFSWQQVKAGPLSALRALLFALFAGSLGLLVWLLIHCRRKLADSKDGTETFLWRAASALTLAAIVATLWIGLVLPLPSICD